MSVYLDSSDLGSNSQCLSAAPLRPVRSTHRVRRCWDLALSAQRVLRERRATPRTAQSAAGHPHRPSLPRSRAPRRFHVARVATVAASPGDSPGDGDPDQPDPPASPWPNRQGLVSRFPEPLSPWSLIPSGPEPVGLLAHGLTGGGR